MSVRERWIDAELCSVRQHKQRLLMSVVVEGTQIQGVCVVASKGAPGERVVNLVYEFDYAPGVCEVSYRAQPCPRPKSSCRPSGRSRSDLTDRPLTQEDRGCRGLRPVRALRRPSVAPRAHRACPSPTAQIAPRGDRSSRADSSREPVCAARPAIIAARHASGRVLAGKRQRCLGERLRTQVLSFAERELGLRYLDG